MRHGPWGLAIRAGSSPSECTSMCPQPCKRQSPWQERSRGELTIAAGYGPQTGVKAQKPIPIARVSVSRLETTENPMKTNRGERLRRIGTWARASRNVRSPDAGASLRRVLVNPMSVARRTRGKDPRRARPRRLESVAEHREKSIPRCMIDVGRRMFEAEALDMTGRS